MQNTENVVGRILLVIIFLISGWGKLVVYSGTMQYLEHLGMPGWFTPLVILLELGGGILIVVGAFTRIVAVLLAAYCIATGFIAHLHPGDAMQMINFWKNIAMAGGFLVLAAYGAGVFSLDRKFKLPCA